MAREFFNHGETWNPGCDIPLFDLQLSEDYWRCEHFILSAREEEVFGLILKGYHNKRIARILKISRNTVRNHVSNILQKAQKETEEKPFNKLEMITTFLKRGILEQVPRYPHLQLQNTGATIQEGI